MESDDDTRPQAQETSCRSPLTALYRALAELLAECDQLDMAIQNQDAEDAEIAAHDAVACLLDAEAALRRFDENVNRADAVLAEIATGSAHRWLVDRFMRVAANIDSKSLRSSLGRLRIGLALASGRQPPQTQ